MKELMEIQKEIKVKKNQYNKFGNYNYRSAEDILEEVKPLLAKHNAVILITDEVKSVNEHIYIEATVVLQVGETAISVKAQAGINPNRKGMDVAQSYGSSSSYAKKYALGNLLLLDDTKDADTKDNTEENKPSTKKEIDEAKQKLQKAYESKSLNAAFFELSTIQQSELRDFANELKKSS
tara:strand:+ start:957 stop:1496 length:540 start_codon:yes stop_codon:yes gene_type:complete